MMPAPWILVYSMYRLLILLTSFIVFNTHSYANSSPCIEHQCIAVIDAGSTGSRLHIYAYDFDGTNSPSNISEIWNKKIKPGFASLEPKPDTIDAYLSQLLMGAPTSDLPVYFYATAGMRLLPPTKQKLYYKELTQWFSQHPPWQLKEARTITGNDEALYDWLSVNYQLGTLKNSQNKTIGVMDMGGASVQIVFPIQKNEKLNKQAQVEFDLYGQHFTLYVHSFLGLGQTEMSHQFLNSVSCFANDYPLPDGDVGRGSANDCEHEVASLMNAVHAVNTAVQPIIALNPVDSWYALGGISHLATSTFFNFENHQLTNQSLIMQADTQICHQPWDVLNAQFPNDDYVYQYCLLSAYYYALMVEGYGIYPEQTINFMPPEQNLDWTWGVVLHH